MYLAWCPDSRCLVVTDSLGEGRPDALFVISVENGEKRRLTSPPAPLVGDSNPAVSPDGSSVVFVRHSSPVTSELYWLALDKDWIARGEPLRLTQASLGASNPTWICNGKGVLFSARGDLWRLPLNGQKPPARLPFVGEDGIIDRKSTRLNSSH